ncbi:MAG TPA: hypothetical protein VF320_10985 [Acidimicrobiales bacterium]
MSTGGTGEAGENDDPRSSDSDIVRRESLRHNQYNAVTTSIEQVNTADGRVLVRKRLGRSKADSPEHWQASDDPHHWNSWRREAAAYRDDRLEASLVGTGLARPAARVEEDAAGITLWLDFVEGDSGAGLALEDHAALARGLGRWQASEPIVVPWSSKGFLRAYSGSKPAAVALIDDDGAWGRPIVRECLPPSLRTGWARLLANRERLLGIMEGLPRVFAHLDVWASNVVRRADGTVVLVDWSFAGDGAAGEDIGNLVPDGVFDLFWPADRLVELEEAVFVAYTEGLGEAGWAGDPRLVRLGMTAACVKYTWMLPGVLAEAADPQPVAYWRTVDPVHKFTARGLGMAHLVGWCDEALALADRLGR